MISSTAMSLSCRRHRGVSLIEVLVSLVILSLGVLAVVALQMIAKRNNADAAQRTAAAQLAYDMIERMRSNSTSATLSAYLTVNHVTGPLGRRSLGDAEPMPNCANASTCTTAQLVTHDLWQWEQFVDGAAERVGSAIGDKAGGLLEPIACIARTTDDGGGDGVYTVTIAWRGTVAIPDSNAGTAQCGRVGQPPNLSSSPLYGAADEFRRSVTLPVYITARRS
jgi:type IV pilus assembly protein PilV